MVGYTWLRGPVKNLGIKDKNLNERTLEWLCDQGVLVTSPHRG